MKEKIYEIELIYAWYATLREWMKQQKEAEYKKAIIYQCVDGIERDTRLYNMDLQFSY